MAWGDTFSKVVPIITGVGGYFVRMFQAESRRRRMRRQLYREISSNNHKIVLRIHVCTSVPGLKQAAPLDFAQKLDISFNVWNFYNDEKRRELLFELKEADAISSIYDKFLCIGMDLPRYAIVRGREAAAEVDERLLDGSLDRKLYKEASSLEAWRFMDDLLQGGRKSHRAFLNPL